MFLQKYKELDNLCKDLLNSEKGVSSYIESMEQCEHSRKIVGWEDELCSKTDEMWIEKFYERIIHFEDPLALHRKYAMSIHQHSKEQKRQTYQNAAVLEYKKIL